MSYKDYLLSEYWKTKRLKILERDNFRCQICSSELNLNVHHKYYSNGAQKKILYREPDYLLITLCQECHTLWHQMYGGVKLRSGKIEKLKKALLKGMSKYEAFNSLPTIRKR